MVQRRGPDRPADHEVREVDEPTLRPLWAEGISSQPWASEPLVQQILEHRRDVGKAIPTRLFAAEADGRLAAHVELYSEGGVGQDIDLVTIRHHDQDPAAKYWSR